MKKVIRIVLGTLFSLAILACDIGLGSEVDLEPPVINITSHKQNDYAPLSFVLSGTYSDNHGLNSIVVSYKYKQTITDESSDNYNELSASFTGKTSGTWSCPLEFPCNQEVVIQVVAYDDRKNESVYSKDTITLVLDAGLPEIGSITLTKDSGYSITAVSIDRYLGPNGKTSNKEEITNKDYFHNENVVITTNVSENYEVKTAVLNLYEITDYDLGTRTYNKNLIHEGIVCSSGKNLFNPEFTITQENLTEWNGNLASGLHYILPEIIITDGAGSKNILNPNQVPNVFAWEAEYDLPHVSISAGRTNGKIRIPEETPMTVKIFDDDGLKSYRWTLEKTTGEIEYRRTGSADLSSRTIRDDNFEIPTGVSGEWTTKLPDGNYTLTIEVEDFNPLKPARVSTVKLLTEDVKITNSDSATINVTAPGYNTTPALSGTNKNEFVLSGDVIDNGEVNYIAIAWCCPGASQSDAENYFETFDFENTAVSKNDAITTSDGKLKVWNIGKDGSSGAVTVTSTFSKTFDIYNDFKDAAGNIVNDIKIIVVGVKDATDNITTEAHRIGAYKSLPKFELSIGDSENGSYVPTTQTTISAEPNKNLYVKVKPLSDSDLPITSFTVGKEGGLPAAATAAEIENGKIFTISETASDSKFKLNYSAKDKLGNENTGTFTVQFEKTPDITDILCREEGATLKSGDVLHFQVTFDKSITVTGRPTLVLNCYAKESDTNPSATMTAEYASGTDSTTLYFNKTLAEGLEYKKISLKKDGASWITLNGGSIKRSNLVANLGTDIDKSGYNLTIDTKKPVLNGVSGQRTGTAANFSRKSITDTSIDIKFNFSEPVTNKNGYITIYRKGSEDVAGDHTWHIPAVISADNFEKIWNNSTSENRIALSSSSTEKSVNTTGTLVSKGPYKMYTNGLKKNDYVIYQYAVSGGNAVKSNTVIAAANTVMVPDLTTKYVLDFPYDTNSTTDETVKKLRVALEAVNYHKALIALSRLTFNEDKTVATLNLKDSDFIDGIRDGVEYIMVIPAGSFVDNVQNATASETKHTFTVGKVAKPVIRVNRWSTNSNTQLDPNNASTATNYLKAGVKIDCETPGAAITYQVTNLYVTSDYGTSTSDYQKNMYAPDIMPGAVGSAVVTETDNETTFNNASSITGSTPAFSKTGYKQSVAAAQNYSSTFYVGTGNVDTGERIYIGANATSTIADLQNSDDVYEGAFKTVLHYNSMLEYSAYTNKYNGNNFKVFACQTPEGVSYVAGWPLSMRQHFHQTSTEVGTEDCYKVAYKAGDYDYKWVSWELLSEDFFTTTSVTWNFQKTIDTLVTYGSYVWGYDVHTWGMTR